MSADGKQRSTTLADVLRASTRIARKGQAETNRALANQAFDHISKKITEQAALGRDCLNVDIVYDFHIGKNRSCMREVGNTVIDMLRKEGLLVQDRVSPNDKFIQVSWPEAASDQHDQEHHG